jgi:hypothetical protein
MKLINRRGQFSIMTAFMVLAVVTSAMFVSFQRIQENQFTKPITLASDIKDVNTALHELLGFTAGYYGSIIKLTGNVTYAREKTNSYFESGLETIAHANVEKTVSLTLNDIGVKTSWFGRVSYTQGYLSVDYSIPSIGLFGMKYDGSALLSVTIMETVGDVCRVSVLGDNDEPNLSLSKDDFSFFRFDPGANNWIFINPTDDPVISTMGVYSINLPADVNRDAYFLQVTDQRGIIVSSGYIRGVGDLNKDLPSYTYTFNWDSLYENLNDPYMEVELLQNGTLRWLGQALTVNGSEKPIPPIPIKGIHVNQTISGVNQEVPFQVEDWRDSYRVPFGLTNNATIFDENCMIVFLVNHNVSTVTVWWNGTDTAKQTPYAYTNVYFTGDDPASEKLDNGVVTIDLSSFGSGIKSTTKSSAIDSWSTYLRVNGESPIYGSLPSYTIHHGIVRDLIQQEPEWSGGVTLSPDFYGQIVLTLPAMTSYYTYRARIMFVQTSANRDLSELSVIQVKAPSGSQLSEDGFTAGLPTTSTSALLYDGGTTHQHQWSEYISNNRGVGVMMRSRYNDLLYTFDDVIGQNTGAISIDTGNRKIELNPIERFSVDDFQRSFDRTWVGAVTNFGSGTAVETIYPTSGGTSGLWIMVELPPSVTIS